VKLSFSDLRAFLEKDLSLKIELPRRVLIVNDDGPESPYTYPLADVLRSSGADVYTVLPYLERSAYSHSVSVYSPVRLHVRDERNYLAEGTPVDCVKIAVKHLFKDLKFDAVISGPNSGYNMGRNIVYSGTVAGALEASFWGFPSFALSFPSSSRLSKFFASMREKGYGKDDFLSPFEVVRRLREFFGVFYSLSLHVRNRLNECGPDGTSFFVNVNFPLKFFLKGHSEGDFKIFFSRPGKAWFREWYEEREDPQGRKFLWLAGEEVEDDTEGVDSWAVSSGMISVSFLNENFSYMDADDFLSEFRRKAINLR